MRRWRICFFFCTFIICHSPQKSSTVRKVYKPDREPLLDSTSPSALTRCHLPYRGEALAFRKVFLPGSKFSSPPDAPLLGATATTAARGGNREELLGQRPARRKRSAADAGSRNPALSSEARLRGCTKTETFLCRKIRLAASFPVSFWRIICYNGFAALPAHLFGRGGEKNGKYSFFYTVCRSKCSSLLYLQVA